MLRNIPNIVVNQGTRFSQHNNLPYSPQFNEACNFLQTNPHEATLYLQERKEGVHTLFMYNHPRTSIFHSNPHLNALFDKDPNDGGLTNNEIAHLEKIFNCGTSGLESKNELPLFPHNNNEDGNFNGSIHTEMKDDEKKVDYEDFINYPTERLMQNEHKITERGYEQRRIPNMPNNIFVRTKEYDVYSKSLMSRATVADTDGIQRILRKMNRNGIPLEYPTIFNLITTFTSYNSISKSKEFIEIIIEHFSAPTTGILYNCEMIEYASLEAIKKDPTKIVNVVYMTVDAQTGQLEYWQKTTREFTKLVLKNGETLTPGKYTQTQFIQKFRNFQPLQKIPAMLFELLFKKEGITVIDLKHIIHHMITFDYPYPITTFITGLIKCSKLIKEASPEDKRKISELALSLFNSIKPHGIDISVYAYFLMAQIMAKCENYPAIEKLLSQGIRDGMFNQRLGFAPKEKRINTSSEQRPNNFITNKFSLNGNDLSSFIRYIHDPLLDMHMERGNITINTRISMVYGDRGENLTAKALKPYYTFEIINGGNDLIITSIKQPRINNF